MRGLLNAIVYVLTAPIRWFGRSRAFRWGLVALIVAGGAFYGTLWALERFMPVHTGPPPRANLPPPRPLPAMTHLSVVIAPVAISLGAIRKVLDDAAPREFVGKNDNPVAQLLGRAEIALTVSRGTLAVTGGNDTLTLTTPLDGNIRISGETNNQASRALGSLGGAIGGLLGDNVGKQFETYANKVLDQNNKFRGTVVATAHPALTAAWRLQPNLAARIDLGDTGADIAGIRINLAGEIRPLLEPTVNRQIAALEAQLRNDPFIERAAREQWAKMCRSIPLGGGNTGLPRLWLEMKPVRAAAAQPRIDGRNATLTVGVQADTRITAKQSKPNCPFPAKLELVPPMDNGKLAVGVPIDVPFTELNKLLEAQLKGHRYPDDGSGPAELVVRGVNVAAAGDRLLISLKVKVTEKKSWFGFGADATVHIWGKPALDRQKQIMRLTDISLAIESEAAYGLLGTAARAALPYLQRSLTERAVVDLKPFAADAQKRIGAALSDFHHPAPGTQVDTKVNGLHLTAIAFDANTLRIIAEAAGAVRVSVRELPRF